MSEEELDVLINEMLELPKKAFEKVPNYNELVKDNRKKNKEIERLNNIINKLEAHCDIELNRLAMGTSNTYEDSLGKTRFVNEDIYNEIGKIKYILQELKGSESNENKSTI